MSAPPEVPKELVCREYLRQQIYSGDDVIIDRMNTVKFNAPGSGKVINKMVKTFCSYAEKYKFEDKLPPYLSLINELADELGFESKEAISDFTNRFKEMKKGQVFDHSIYFMTVISSVIESFQTKVVSRLSLRLGRKIHQKKRNEVQKNLETLFETSNTTLSLLVNLEIMKEMSRLLGVEMEPILTDPFENELIAVLKDM